MQFNIWFKCNALNKIAVALRYQNCKNIGHENSQEKGIDKLERIVLLLLKMLNLWHYIVLTYRRKYVFNALQCIRHCAKPGKHYLKSLETLK